MLWLCVFYHNQKYIQDFYAENYNTHQNVLLPDYNLTLFAELL
jgi:hypothetical protein